MSTNYPINSVLNVPYSMPPQNSTINPILGSNDPSVFVSKIGMAFDPSGCSGFRLVVKKALPSAVRWKV